MFKRYLGRDSALAGEEVRRLLNKVRSGFRCFTALNYLGSSVSIGNFGFAVYRLAAVPHDQDLPPPTGQVTAHFPMMYWLEDNFSPCF